MLSFFCRIPAQSFFHIDKTAVMINNIITLIKHLIKDMSKRRKQHVTADHDKAGRDYF